MKAADYRAELAATMSEDQLLNQVLALTAGLHLHTHHCRPARLADGTWRTPIQGDAGFPDLVIVGPGGVLFRELKSQRGNVSTAQRGWIDQLVKAGEDTCVWRPSDLVRGHVLSDLQGVAE